MARVSLTIDGAEAGIEDGSTILEAARSIGVYIPALCAHPALPPAVELKAAHLVQRGAERIEGDGREGSWDGCGLCAVEVDGEIVRACATRATEGMRVVTDTEEVAARRSRSLSSILGEHPHACLTCAQAEGCSRTQCSSNVPENERCCELLGSCELGRIAHFVGIPADLPRYRNRGYPILTEDPLFDFDTELCVGCLRCVRACNELRGVGTLGFTLKDGRPVVGTLDAATRREGDCRFCGACVEVCPTGALMDRVRATGEAREKALVPCRHACPAGIDIPRLLRHVAAGEPSEAAAVVREKVPLAFAASYACFHPCEDACRRSDLNQPLSVCRLKRFALDSDDGSWRDRLEKAPPTGRTVNIVGSGPAGLTAAWYLALKGHAVTVHEALPEPGGMLRVGIPEYRYPRELLARDVDEVCSLGVRIECGSPVDQEGFEKIVAESDAVFVAAGAHRARRINIDGGDLHGVYWGVDFLRDRALGRLDPDSFDGARVVVVGGGNVAVDAARVARRLGAASVSMITLESAGELPAWDWEVREAVEEDVTLMHSWGPTAVTAGGCGRVAGLRLRRCTRVFDVNGLFAPEYDDSVTDEIAADAVILAIGQDPSSGPFASLGLGRQGTIEHREDTMATSNPKVWAGGDVAAGPSSFIEAVAMGRAAAADIDRALGGDGSIDTVLVDRAPVDQRLGRIDGFAAMERSVPAIRQGSERAASFAAIEDTLDPEAARAEAMRCLNCDLRLAIEPAPMPPAKEEFHRMTAEAIATVPSVEGVFQILDAGREVIAIRGVMDLRQGLTDALDENESAAFFVYEEDPMYTKRESELIQRHIQEHGELPGGGDDELDDLF